MPGGRVRKDVSTETTPLKPGKTPSATAGPSLSREPVNWFRNLGATYSWKLIAMVVCANHILKGLVAGGGDGGFLGKPIEFLFRAHGVPAGRLQVLSAVAYTPWALKPLIGLLSDACPIMGYRKMPYIIGTTVISLAAVTVLGVVPTLTLGLPLTVACLFLAFFQVASVDLLLQAKQSEEVKKCAQLGPDFFTFTWLGINLGQVAAIFTVGGIIHHFGPQMSYLVVIPFVALILWPATMNFLGERRLPVGERGLSSRLFRKYPEMSMLCLLMGLLILSMNCATFYLHEEVLIWLSLGIAFMVIFGFSFFIRGEISGPVIFYFLLQMCSFNCDGALFYFFTDTHEQYPGGPHFSIWFYTAGIGLATFGGIFVGFLTGDEWFKSWSYRSVIAVTVILRVFTQLMMLPVLLRWTIATNNYGGDAVWVLVTTFLDTMVFAWRWIPKQVMGAHLTPTGVESTMLALNAGIYNLSGITGAYIGSYLLHHFGVRPTGAAGEAAMFGSLWKAHVFSALAPLFTLLLIPFLVPNREQTEPLITHHEHSATYGSPYDSRWGEAAMDEEEESALRRGLTHRGQRGAALA